MDPLPIHKSHLKSLMDPFAKEKWAALRYYDFFPITMWPQWARSLYLKSHKNRVDRFTLFCFLVGNGMEPKAARHCILIGQYDNAAHNQMAELVKKGPGGNKNIMYWDIQNKRNMRFQMYS